jgi:hypothetical protein
VKTLSPFRKGKIIMKNRFLSLLLLICVIFGMFTGCQPQLAEWVDYAGQAVLSLNGIETIKQEVTVKQYDER